LEGSDCRSETGVPKAMSQINTNAILDATGGTTTTVNGYAPTASNMAGRNRIINGDMRIDQRNAGASVTPASAAYTLDRWWHQLSQASKLSVQRSAVAPAGFTNSALITSLSAYSVGASDYFNILQNVEGFNVADLGWGTAEAQAITISFRVRSSLTGTFGGGVLNSDQARAYPFSYTISAANTWETKTITVPGDTTGTWLTDNGTGLRLSFGLGVGSSFSSAAGSWAAGVYLSATGATSVVGTSGATFYITGVQLEVGSVATPFEHRQYGQELALCQRYLPAFRPTSANEPLGTGYCANTTLLDVIVNFQVPARVPVTGITTSAANTFSQNVFGNAITGVAILAGGATATTVRFTTAGVAQAQANGVRSLGSSTYILFTGCEL